MLFNEKLYKLRKENHLSQEVLAERLGTTRQAVSKWENGQGFPETEKLLLISNMFEVSADYLLKDTQEDFICSEKGYYVSREMAEGYIANQKKWLKKFTLGIFVLILSITVFLKFDLGTITPVVMLVMIILGSFWTLQGIVSSDARYKVLEKEPLIFDVKYLSELKLTAEKLSRIYTPVFLISFIIMMISVLALPFHIGSIEKEFGHGIPLYAEIAIAALALATSIMFYSGTMLESYQLLAKNEERVQGFWFRFRRLMKKKTDALLK